MLSCDRAVLIKDPGDSIRVPRSDRNAHFGALPFIIVDTSRDDLTGELRDFDVTDRSLGCRFRIECRDNYFVHHTRLPYVVVRVVNPSTANEFDCWMINFRCSKRRCHDASSALVTPVAARP